MAQKKETVGLSSNPVRTCVRRILVTSMARGEPGKVDEVFVTSAVGVVVHASRVECFIVRRPTLFWRKSKFPSL